MSARSRSPNTSPATIPSIKGQIGGAGSKTSVVIIVVLVEQSNDLKKQKLVMTSYFITGCDVG